jgi:cytochrome c556
MRSIWARTAVVAITIVILGSTPQLASAQRGDPAVDTRQRVGLPEAQRNQILAEMRGMLESVRGILFGLAHNDMAAVQRAAQASSAEATANAQLDQRLPKQFLQFRLLTHEGFKSLAAEARAGASQADLLTKVAGITSYCLGCHNAFRVVDTAASPSRSSATPAPR